jgi:glucose-1-phosphate adenylyltransferase
VVKSDHGNTEGVARSEGFPCDLVGVSRLDDIGTLLCYSQCNLDLEGSTQPCELASAEAPIDSRGRFLPPSRIDGASIHASLVSDGCIVEQGAVIENSVIGLRCRIGKNVVIRNSVVLGSDYYETTEDIASNTARGLPPMGIGEGTIIEGAIVDKNVRIGTQTRIVNDHGWDEIGDSTTFTVRDGVAIVPKDAIVPDGWRPDPTLNRGA